MNEVVKGKYNSTYWEVEIGQECEVLSHDIANGEGWYKLRDIETGKIFDSPDSFWEKV